MPIITIPSQDTKRFIKPSTGEILGNLHITRNIDLRANVRKIRLAERICRLTDDENDTDMEVPVKFIRTNADQTDRWWALVQASANAVDDGLLFKTNGTTPNLPFTQDAIANSPTDCVDDMEIFGQANSYDRLIVARDTDLAMMNDGAWDDSWWVTTLGQSALTATNPHPLEQFINLLLVIDGNVVHTIDDSLVVTTSRIVLPKEYQIIWTANDGDRVYFGTRHIRGGRALVFPWNGTDTTYDRPLSVNDSISFAGLCSAAGIIHTINGKGQLLKYNGCSFDEVAAFPLLNSKARFAATDLARGNAINPNGMVLIEGKINILINAKVSTVLSFENMPSGIWEFDEEIGLYHKYGIGQYNGDTDNDWGAFEIIVAGALTETQPVTGRFLVGAEVYKDNRTTKLEGIFVSQGVSTIAQRGYFVTSQIFSSSVRAFWKRLNLSFKKFEASTDRMILKYRTDKNKNLIGTDGTIKSFQITWSDTDTFTSTSTTLANASVGDEIEIMIGKGAGAITHISSISEIGGTYTVNLDEAIPNVSGSSIAKIQNWKKLGEISSQDIQEQLYKIAKRSKWIQFKVELRGTEQSPEFEELLLKFNYSKR